MITRYISKDFSPDKKIPGTRQKRLGNFDEAINKAYARIPRYDLKTIPINIHTDHPLLACAAIIKKGLDAAYQNEDAPIRRTLITALVDLRHLCDIIGLNFFEINLAALKHHAGEASEARKLRQTKNNRGKGPAFTKKRPASP
ncbi:hypothetical protein OH491_24360 [Termitidicoccus mucosus]|uniref:Uncharacterized protein n=1 Tax=Termitidicoccus mucosus TaxID=1184151 RepID=A0A178IPI5_9BACT|nr:hypothetical protein AW736_02090 [Opitutaceae bacterium TSB47]